VHPSLLPAVIVSYLANKILSLSLSLCGPRTEPAISQLLAGRVTSSSVRFARGVEGGGLTPPPTLHEDDLPTGTCLGVGFDPPERFQKQLDKTWGTKEFSARFARRLFVSQRLNL